MRAASRRQPATHRDSQIDPAPATPASISRLGAMKPPSTTLVPSNNTPSSVTTPLNDSTASVNNASVTTPITPAFQQQSLGNGNTSVNGSAFSVNNDLICSNSINQAGVFI